MILIGRDILDKQLVDRKKVPMGKVDGLVLELRRDKPPRALCIEIGGIAPARRLPGIFGRVLVWCARRFGARKGAPCRIAWSKVADLKELEMVLDIDAYDSEALHWERVVRDRIIRKIPGN